VIRPTLLIAEIEPPDGLSARKLVLETAKFNVLTAYSVDEALKLLNKFPQVNAMVLHASLCDEEACQSVIDDIRQHKPKLTLIVISPIGEMRFAKVDYHVSSHEPQELLDLVRSLFGDPRELKSA
jgi:DNA-binding NtrC family response regulator